MPTHWDKRCGWACALLNLAMAAALRGGSPETVTPERLLEDGAGHVRASLGELKGFGYDERIPASVSEAVQGAFETKFDDLSCDGSDRGFTLLALQIGLLVYWGASSFEEGLTSVIEAGGDTERLAKPAPRPSDRVRHPDIWLVRWEIPRVSGHQQAADVAGASPDDRIGQANATVATDGDCKFAHRLVNGD